MNGAMLSLVENVLRLEDIHEGLFGRMDLCTLTMLGSAAKGVKSWTNSAVVAREESVSASDVIAGRHVPTSTGVQAAWPIK